MSAIRGVPDWSVLFWGQAGKVPFDSDYSDEDGASTFLFLKVRCVFTLFEVTGNTTDEAQSKTSV